MTTAFNIPLKPGIPQSFLTTLNGIDYRLTLQWRDAANTWIMDLLDVFGNPLACGLPLVTGANILQQFPDLNIGGEMWVITDGAPSDTPTFNSLGATSHLWYVVDGTVLTNFAPSGARASPVITVPPPGLIPIPILPPGPLEPTMVGVGGVTGSALQRAIASAVIAGQGGVIANLVRRTLASATIPGLGIVAARPIFQPFASATIAGASSVIGRLQAKLLAKATFAGTGSIAASAVNLFTAAGVRLPAGWTLQRLDTFGTANSVPGPIRLHTLYNEAIFFDQDGTGRVQVPNTVINSQQQQYQHFEDSTTWLFMSDRLRMQARGQGDNSIKSGQMVTSGFGRSFIFEVYLTAPATLGTWIECWNFADSSGGDSSEIDTEIVISNPAGSGSKLDTHSYSIGNIGDSGQVITIDDSHVTVDVPSGSGLVLYRNTSFNVSSGPSYYTTVYDDTGAGSIKRYLNGVLLYHSIWKWNSTLGGTGFGPDPAMILDLAVGGVFPGNVATPSAYSGDMDIYSIGIYAPGAASRALPAGEAWSFSNKAASISLSGNDLIATGSDSGDAIVYAVDAMFTGKYYWEIELSSNSCAVGIGCHDNFGFTWLGNFGNGVGWYGAGRGAAAGLYCNGAKVASWEAFNTTPARLCLAVHVVAGVSCKFWGRVGAAGNWNNDVIGNQNPAADLGGFDLPFSAFRLVRVTPSASTFSPGDTITMKAASGSWVGTPPAGFSQIGPT